MRRLGLLLLVPLVVLGSAFVVLRYLGCIFTRVDTGWRIALMVDEAANVSANGQVNTTISGRAGRAAYAGRAWGCVLCWVLDKIQPDHCEEAAKR